MPLKIYPSVKCSISEIIWCVSYDTITPAVLLL